MIVGINNTGMANRLMWSSLVVFALVFCGDVAAKDNTRVNVDKPGVASFSFETDSDLPIIVYHDVVEMIANRDEQPLLKIYADGLVQVHHPVYKKNAGDFEMRLSQQELVALLESLAENGLMELDTKKLKLQKQKADNENKEPGKFFHISDSVVTRIEINLKDYKSAKTKIRQTDFKKRIQLRNIEQDIKHYGDIEAVRKTDKNVSKLKSLLKREELKRK